MSRERAEIPTVRPQADSDDLPQIIDELCSGIRRQENFRRLYNRYYRLIRHFFRQRGFPADHGEDLAQETFLSVYRGIHSFRGESSFESWLFRIAENVSRQSRRSKAAQKRAAQEVSLEEAGDSPHQETVPAERRQQTPEPLRRLLAQERVHVLWQALEELPPQMRRCTTLRITQEMSYREIAEVLQLSVDVVKVQLFRARSRLRRQLADHGDGLGF